jgi:hypothetical protein
VVVAQDPLMQVRELVPNAGLTEMLRSAGHDFKNEAKQKREEEEARRANDPEVKAHKVRQEVAKAAFAALLQRAESASVEDLGRALAATFMEDPSGVFDEVLERRGMTEAVLREKLSAMTVVQLMSFFLECRLIENNVLLTYGGYDQVLVDACAVFSIDVTALERERQAAAGALPDVTPPQTSAPQLEPSAVREDDSPLEGEELEAEAPLPAAAPEPQRQSEYRVTDGWGLTPLDGELAGEVLLRNVKTDEVVGAFRFQGGHLVPCNPNPMALLWMEECADVVRDAEALLSSGRVHGFGRL